MEFPRTGGCLCARVRYEITEAPQLVYTCHCADCQRLTSSAFSMGIVLTDRAFWLTGIEPRSIRNIADSGRGKISWVVCSECGCWVCSVPEPDAGERRIRCGTLDDTSWLRPTAHSGPAASNLGSPCRRAIRFSRRSPADENSPAAKADGGAGTKPEEGISATRYGCGGAAGLINLTANSAVDSLYSGTQKRSL